MTETPRVSGPLVVVFDSNVLIPLCLPSGRSLSTRLLGRLKRGGAVVRVSPQILEEVAEKMRKKNTLRRWLQLTDREIEEFVQGLPGVLGYEPLPGKVTAAGAVKTDPTDDKIMAAAIEASASYVVSEDGDLLDLKEYHGIKIMTRREFAAELDRLGWA